MTPHQVASRKSPVAGLVSVPLAFLVLASLAAASCAPDPEKERLKATTQATYNKETGRLERLTYDANKNGVIDTWTYMDGTKTLRSEIDANEDGRIERWEYYGGDGKVERWEDYGDDGKGEKVALSRADTGVADMWLYPGPDGTVARAEMSERPDGAVDRWEWYEAGVIVRAEEDDNGDGAADKWEAYAAGAVVSAAFDENGDGRPDRRLNYGPGGALLSIESEPDQTGAFTKKVDVQRDP